MALTRVNNQALLGASGTVLQVVQSTSTSTFEPNSGGAAWTDTGYSVSITPISSSSKVLFSFSGAGILLDSSYAGFRLMRNTTAVHQEEVLSENSTQWAPFNFAFSYLDSPASTSAVTYKVQGWSSTLSADQEFRINFDGTASGTPKAVCIAMEIAG